MVVLCVFQVSTSDPHYGLTSRETAIVVLWGTNAHQFLAEALQQQMQQGPVAILFVALTVKLYEGDILVLGCSFVSLVLFSY